MVLFVSDMIFTIVPCQNTMLVPFYLTFWDATMKVKRLIKFPQLLLDCYSFIYFILKVKFDCTAGFSQYGKTVFVRI